MPVLTATNHRHIRHRHILRQHIPPVIPVLPTPPAVLITNPYHLIQVNTRHMACRRAVRILLPLQLPPQQAQYHILLNLTDLSADIP